VPSVLAEADISIWAEDTLSRLHVTAQIVRQLCLLFLGSDQCNPRFQSVVRVQGSNAEQAGQAGWSLMWLMAWAASWRSSEKGLLLPTLQRNPQIANTTAIPATAAIADYASTIFYGLVRAVVGGLQNLPRLRSSKLASR
jgi:hypothetical protein